MSRNIIWTIEEDEALINIVKKHQMLYNIKNKVYRKFDLKQNLWNEVGTLLNKSGPNCSKRWVYVRDYFVRRRGKPAFSYVGEAARRRSELLSFLNSQCSQKSCFANVFVNENEEDGTTTTTDSDTKVESKDVKFENVTRIIEHNSNICVDEDKNYEQNSYKRKRKQDESEASTSMLHLVQNQTLLLQHELDDTDHFFMSMSKIVKKLPQYERAELRMQIATLVGNAELRHISNKCSTPRATSDE